MPKSAIITLTTAGTDTGPFNLLSDIDSYATPFETNIAKSSLIAGYTTNLVPDAATIVRVQSSSSLCTNFINLTYPTSTTTTTTSTTTTTTTAPPTTTTTTTSTTTTTTTVAYTEWSARYDVVTGSICSQNAAAVYTVSGAGFTTGDTIYVDASLTMPLIGYNYISEVATGTVYNINNGTGIIGTSTGNSC